MGTLLFHQTRHLLQPAIKVGFEVLAGLDDGFLDLDLDLAPLQVVVAVRPATSSFQNPIQPLFSQRSIRRLSDGF